MKKKYKNLHYGRLAFCFLVLFVLIISICLAVKSCLKNSESGRDNNKTDTQSESSDNIENQNEDESISEPEAVIEPPKLTEYNFDYEDVTFTENIDINAYEPIILSKDEIFRGELVLVNNETEYIFSGTEETDFVQLNTVSNDSYYVKDNTVLVDECIVAPLNEMMADFEASVGKQINIISGYRGYEKQQQLYDEDLAETGDTSSTLVALPGFSEHHCGFAMDFSILIDGAYYSYDGIGDESWINENCWKYGFILRYPEGKSNYTFIQYEPWHFRYIGRAHAFIVNYFEMCYEEYVAMLRSYSFGSRHLGVNIGDESYEIYYVPADDLQTEVFVPIEREYEISGNNIDGFIVTVKLD